MIIENKKLRKSPVTLPDYIPARLVEGKEWYVFFYALDPYSQRLRRKRVKFNRIKNKLERRRIAQQLVVKINRKLAEGWNPFLEEHAPKAFYKLSQAAETFLAEKKKEMRPDGFRSYKSFIGSLQDWLDTTNQKDINILAFNKYYAVELLESIYNRDNVSEKTYNNYLIFYRLFWNWLIERNYTNHNPFKDLTKKKEKQKNRDIIDAPTRVRIKEYLEKDDYPYLIMCLMAFHVLIRPKEMTGIKIKDIDMERQTIFIPAQSAKNNSDRIGTMPDYMVEMIRKMNLEHLDKDYYLFSEGFVPGKVKIDSRKIAKRWEKLRKDLNLPMNIKFYSLRDSGIIQMLEDGISAEYVRHQADHSSLDMTTIYSKHARPEGIEQIKHKSKAF